LDKAGIAYEALDNGILCCAKPQRLQQILEQLDETRIEAVVRKWFARLPHPFTAEDRAAGYRYELSILQAEFARTQVFDRPLSGRHLFEEVIRENIDLGRPDNVSLIFERRITKRTPGRFRTRVITHGVTPSLHVSYKSSKIKQYFKEERALRTETTINNTRDFALGRRLDNLPALRAIGFAANRRLVEVEKISQDCQLSEAVFDRVTRPQLVEGQRASALTFGDPRVMALLQALCLFVLLPQGFRNATLRALVAQLMGESLEQYTPARMTYDLRRLRLHGIIEKVPGTQRYQLTPEGLRICLFLTKVHVTDRESRIMLTAGGGFEQSYNAQAGVDVDTHLIVEEHLTNHVNDKQEVDHVNDKQEVAPALEKLAALPEEMGEVDSLLADGGYHSEANIDLCEQEGIESFIPAGRDTHNPPLDERFADDPEPPANPTPVQATAHRLRTRAGKALYAKRKSTVETVFGIIKQVLGFRQFLLRGLHAVQGEWTLVCIGWNLKRLFVLKG